MNKVTTTVAALAATVIFFGCGGGRVTVEPPELPAAEREFRGVWVATVGNIDWPSRPGLTTEEQQREALAILDTVAALRMNAVVFQVRPHCDALYASDLEPWSSYLTGEQGKAPEPYYDPLRFWTDEAHKRGIELHAWFNPYRAFIARGGREIPATSVAKQRPELVRKTGGDLYWLDPSLKEVQDLSYAVVMDVVKRYDIDGVHFDDYFYPYGDGTFPDDESWERYRSGGGPLSREDWRRSHVNTFIERVYRGIKTEKPAVKFGLSPFGIWRPRYPASITGYDQYNRLFADAKLWLNEGWIDYWTPQLYWPVNQVPQSFPVLLGWWANENTKGRHLWPGMIINRPRDERTADEIFNQIMIARGFVPQGPGHVHFSMKAFLRDSTVMNPMLTAGPYQRPALVPPTPWLDDDAPAAPAVTVTTDGDSLRVVWSHAAPSDVFRSVLYYRYNSVWTYDIVSGGSSERTFPLRRTVTEPVRNARADEAPRVRTETLTAVGVSASDRMGNESIWAPVTVKTDTAAVMP